MARPDELADLEVDLTRNGLSFLQRSIDAAAGVPPDHQSLAFAITDLAASVEVLMKARLAREHWTLIVVDPDKVTSADVMAGTAKTVTPDQAFKRLGSVAGVSWRSDHAARVAELGRLRNRAMHFTAAKTVPAALATCWGDALDLAIWLLDHEFRAQADGDVRTLVEAAIEVMSTRVGELDDLRAARMISIASELGSAEVRVRCPRCQQWTLMLVEGEVAHCAYCVWRPVDGEEAAAEYAGVVLGESSYSAAHDGVEWVVHHCLNCAEQALVDGIRPLTEQATTSSLPSIPCDPDTSVHWSCFACGYTLTGSEVDRCSRCNAITDSGVEGMSVCSSCLEDYMVGD